MTTGATAYVIFPDGTSVAAELAESDESREAGLMFRPALGEREGMLFTFDTPRRYAFWMRNVLIPLDILWLDRRGRVVWLVESAQPCEADPCPTYVPAEKAVFVLEVPGGFARRHGVGVGDTVTIDRDT